MAVDLDALEEEIASFGSVMTSDIDGDWLDVELEVTKFRVHRDGFICENDGTDMTGIILSLARAVSPSAPEGLRERIAKAAFDAHSKSIDVSVHQAKWPPHRDWVVRYETEADYILDVIALAGLTVADAVLAVLPPAPRVDVDAVLKLIDEFAAVSVRSIFHPEVTPQINEQFAAIWAMLEGTA